MRKKKSYRIFLIALMTLSIASGLSSCIYEDMSKCGKDYKIKYNLVLHTQIHTLIDIDLNTTEEQNIANRLKQELGTIFTDHALDNDLSFFIGKDLYRHEANIMNANSVSYTIYLPRNDYRNLSLANTGNARNVKITGANACKALSLEQEQKDTIDSHNIGLFTSRLTINEADFEHDLQTTLYMANCAAAVVINQQEVKPAELYHIIAKVNGKYTETILTLNEPLKAGRLKLIKAKLKADGSLVVTNASVGVSVKLDWKPGGSHDVEI